MLVCGDERMDEWYVKNEIRSEGNAALFWRFVHHGKREKARKAPFQPSYSQSVEIYLSALHRPQSQKKKKSNTNRASHAYGR